MIMAYGDINKTTDDINKILNHADAKVVNHGVGDTTLAMTPNQLHVWGVVDTLQPTFAPPTDTTRVNEYMFRFTSPAGKGTTLVLPSAVKWAKKPNVQANKTYEVSIIDNYGLIIEY